MKLKWRKFNVHNFTIHKFYIGFATEHQAVFSYKNFLYHYIYDDIYIYIYIYIYISYDEINKLKQTVEKVSH